MYMNRLKGILVKLFGRVSEPSESRAGHGNFFFTRLFNKEERRERREYKKREKARRKMQEKLQAPEYTPQAIRKRVSDTEAKNRRALSEAQAKAEDYAGLKMEHEKAFETFKDRYDWDIPREEWDTMWDIWGGISQEIKDAYGGSDPKKPGGSNLVYMYKELKNEGDKKRFPEILKEIYENAPGGTNQEQLVDMVYSKIEELNENYDKME